MTIEDEIFKRCNIIESKLSDFGFVKKGQSYFYSTLILNDTFRIDIEIHDQKVKGKVIELAFDEEYINIRIESQNGNFVNTVRHEFESVLLDIKEKCCVSTYFIYNQSNRIAKRIKDLYGNDPVFPWKDKTGYGVFKNPVNNKWYGLIMNINQNKFSLPDQSIEVMNLKVDNACYKEGIYPAYHMNKKSWVSIFLNDTLSDDEIMSYIEKSHSFTEQNDEWLIPANAKYYDMVHCFDHTDQLYWKQAASIQTGNTVYLYVGAPFSSIFYQCRVTEVNIPADYKDENLTIKKMMKLQCIKKYPHDLFKLSYLKNYGINSIRGARRISKELSEVLNNQ